MHSPALKKSYIQDNARMAKASWDKEAEASMMCRLIAQQSEEACHLPGNKEGPDLEEFALKYNLTTFA